MAITTQRINNHPRFTHYIVASGFLKNDPLAVIDAGARNGFEKHWDLYEDQVNLIGLELDHEECKKLNASTKGDNKKYYPVALSDRKGIRKFFIQPHLASSSFYKSDKLFVERFPGWTPLIPHKLLRVRTSDLDSFVRDNKIKDLDFMKFDIEGAELDVFKGGKKTLKNCLGLSTEAVFYPWRKEMPTFSELDIFLRSIGFVLFDLPVFRWEKKTTSPLMFTDRVLGPTDRGQAVWTQAIYLKDPAAELKRGLINNWPVTRILKLASIMELYNLEDCAIELIQTAAEHGLLKDYDVSLLVDLITPPLNGRTISYVEYVEHIRRVGPPRFINGKRVSKEKYDLITKNR